MRDAGKTNKEDPGYIKIKRSEIFMGTLVESLFGFPVAGTHILNTLLVVVFFKNRQEC